MRHLNMKLILLILLTFAAATVRADEDLQNVPRYSLSCENADGTVTFESSRLDPRQEPVYRLRIGQQDMVQADIDGLPRIMTVSKDGPVGVPNLIPAKNRLARRLSPADRGEFSGVEIRREGSVTFRAKDGESGQIRYAGSMQVSAKKVNGCFESIGTVHMFRLLITPDMLESISAETRPDKTRDGISQIALRCVETRSLNTRCN